MPPLRPLGPVSLVVLLALALLLAGCGGSSGPKQVPPGMLAVVGDQQIPIGSLDDLLAQAKASYKQRKQAFPKQGTTDYTSLQDAATSYLVDQAEIAQAAQDKLGVEVSDAQVNARVQQIVKGTYKGKQAQLDADLKNGGTSLALFRQEIKGTLVSQAVQAKLGATVKVSEADALAYYKSHRSTYKVPYKYREVAHILVKTKSQAQSLYQQIEKGGDFTSLAKKYSQDSGSAPNGGIICVAHGGNDSANGCSQTVAPFDKVAFALKTGQVSPPVKSQFGWHVIKALGAVSPPTTQPFAAVKSNIVTTLTQQRQQTAVAQWVQGVTKDYCAGKVAYQVGYRPATTGCPAVATTTTG